MLFVQSLGRFCTNLSLTDVSLSPSLLLLIIIILVILIIMYWLIGKIISTLAVFSSNQFQLSKVGAAPREKEIKLVDMGADVKEY